MGWWLGEPEKTLKITHVCSDSTTCYEKKQQWNGKISFSPSISHVSVRRKGLRSGLRNWQAYFPGVHQLRMLRLLQIYIILGSWVVKGQGWTPPSNLKGVLGIIHTEPSDANLKNKGEVRTGTPYDRIRAWLNWNLSKKKRCYPLA